MGNQFSKPNDCNEVHPAAAAASDAQRSKDNADYSSEKKADRLAGRENFDQDINSDHPLAKQFQIKNKIQHSVYHQSHQARVHVCDPLYLIKTLDRENDEKTPSRDDIAAPNRKVLHERLKKLLMINITSNGDCMGVHNFFKLAQKDGGTRTHVVLKRLSGIPSPHEEHKKVDSCAMVHNVFDWILDPSQNEKNSIQKPEIARIQHWLRYIVEELAHYHYDAKIAHECLDFDNMLLFDDGTEFGGVALGGFAHAVARISASAGGFDTTGATSGQRRFCSPQAIEKYYTENRPPLAPSDDMWSLGVCLYGMLYQRYPFHGYSDIVYGIFSSDKLHRSDPNRFSPCPLPKKAPTEEEIKTNPEKALISLIQKLLNTDPNKRPSAEDLLKNEWLYGGDYKSTERYKKALMIAILPRYKPCFLMREHSKNEKTRKAMDLCRVRKNVTDFLPKYC